MLLPRAVSSPEDDQIPPARVVSASEPAPDPKARMPRQIPFIIGNEGCERFSFYGMRNILTPFLVTTLLAFMPDETMRKAEAKNVFHTFVIGVYFFPLLGGWLADRFFGKYNTIFGFSLIYCAGHACLALFEDSVNGFFFGLFLIALGAGGIKPLVASFMGDQFDQTNKHLAKVVFDAFYWIINFGSFFASLLMPVFLASWGPSIAFGIPGALMLVATIVLWIGRKRYVMVPRPPRDPHSFVRVCQTALLKGGGAGLVVAIIGPVLGAAAFGLGMPFLGLDFVEAFCSALVFVIAFGGIGASMSLDSIRGEHPPEAIEGVRAVLRILIVFALVTPFHSLFDQKATTWVLQGGDMHVPAWEIDLWILGVWETTFQPAQMQAINPALVMILIPFNNIILYPFLRRRGWDISSIRRMNIGLAISGLAWVVAGVIQLQIDDAEKNTVSILWQVLPYIVLTFSEVLVSATGLEFAYSQAPPSMKGVIMSFWNLTTAIGSLWVLLTNTAIRNETVTGAITSTGLSETAFLMFFFAVFALVVAGVFRLYARRYKVVDHYRRAT